MRISVAFLPFLIACTDGTTTGGGGGILGSGWPAGVIAIDAGAVDGDLSDGDTVDLDWADQSSVACWPGTEDANFSGTHVLYGTYIPENSLLTATVTPDADVDTSVYVIEYGTDTYDVPPDIVSCVSCEAGYDAQTDSNPGEEDSAAVTALGNPYNVLIGVAGAAGYIAGGYTLTVTIEDY